VDGITIKEMKVLNVEQGGLDSILLDAENATNAFNETTMFDIMPISRQSEASMTQKPHVRYLLCKLLPNISRLQIIALSDKRDSKHFPRILVDSR
jgi:hypothetical protein